MKEKKSKEKKRKKEKKGEHGLRKTDFIENSFLSKEGKKGSSPFSPFFPQTRYAFPTRTFVVVSQIGSEYEATSPFYVSFNVNDGALAPINDVISISL